MKNKRFTSLLIILMSIILCLSSAQAGIMNRVVINQILQQGGQLTVYVNMLDEEYLAVNDTYAAKDFSVTLGGEDPFSPEKVQLASQSSEGITYVLGFDTSRSVTNNEVRDMRQAVGAFIDAMRPQDTMRLMAFGESVITMQDFTSDKTLLKAALEKLDNLEPSTYLYQGISAAMDAISARSSGEQRAVIILFTDGMDDSDNGFGESEVINQILQTKVPIYTVGLTGTLKNADLSSVGAISRYSGGALYSEKKYKVAGCLDNIRGVINNAVSLSFKLPYDFSPLKTLHGRSSV